MNEHDDIRQLIPLAAADDLSPGEMRRVREHVAACATCRRVSTDFNALARGLGHLPTPQPSSELVARVQALAAVRLERRLARGNDAAVVIPLVAASWLTALLSWPMLRAASDWVFRGWSLPGGDFGSALAAYSVFGFLLAGIAALAISRHAQGVRRIR